MDTKAALELINERARGNGWAEWTELCETAGIDGGTMRDRTEDGHRLINALASAGVRIYQPQPANEPTRFMARL